MMGGEPAPPPGQPSLLRRIFISPDEPRLRAGWRLTVHGLLMIGLVVVTSVLVAIPMALFGFASLERLAELQLPLTAVAMLPAVTLATWIARRTVDRRSFQSLGLPTGNRVWGDLIAGALIPAPLFGLAYASFSALDWLQFEGWAWGQGAAVEALLSLLVMLIVFVAVGFYEELLFRGYYLQNLIEGINLPAALVLTSAGFSLAHLGNFNASLASVVGITLAGFFLAFAWYRGGSLWLPIGVHIGWNFFQGPIFGFEVSGTPTPTLLQHSVTGPELVTGGAFGPEAGLIVIPLMALGSGLIWWYTQGRSRDRSN